MKPIKSALASALIEMHKKATQEDKARLEEIMRDLRDKIEATHAVRRVE